MDGPRVTGDIGGGDDSSASDASSDSESGFFPPAEAAESVAQPVNDHVHAIARPRHGHAASIRTAHAHRRHKHDKRRQPHTARAVHRPGGLRARLYKRVRVWGGKDERAWRFVSGRRFG